MPPTTDEKLLALSREVIETFDKANGGVHSGFRPAHAKGILLTGAFALSSEAASLTRAPHLHRDSTPVTVRLSDLPGSRPLPTTTRRVPARAALQCAFTWASMSTPISSLIPSTASLCAPLRNSWSS